MRLSGGAAAALLVAAWACSAAAQDKPYACDMKADLEQVLDCFGSRVQTRPLDKQDLGYACTNVDALQFRRPAAGRRVLGFGERTQFGSSSYGVVIETRNVASVVAPFDAVVIYANDFRSYGRLVVLELGCGMRFLLAGLGEVLVTQGQAVVAGEPVGFMGAAKGNDNPVLYVELRRDGRPVDPGSDIAGN